MLANLEMNTMYLFNQLSLQLIYSTGTTHGWIEHNLSLDHYFSPRVSSKKLQCEANLKGNIIVYAEDRLSHSGNRITSRITMSHLLGE